MKLIVLGAPGGGKSTQARNLAKAFDAAHVSTGDVLRDHMKRETPIGLSIKDIMKKGQLVPDELVIELVKEYIQSEDCVKGFVLDGFPRTLVQAEAFDKLLKEMSIFLDKVVYVQVDDEIIVERMSGRIVCPKCKAMFHKEYFPSKKGEYCDICGEELVQREDDKPETVKNRLRIYHEITEPMIDFYRQEDMLYEISGVGEINEITESIVGLLRK